MRASGKLQLAFSYLSKSLKNLADYKQTEVLAKVGLTKFEDSKPTNSTERSPN